MLGEHKKMIKEKFCLKLQERPSKLEKRLLPGSGETDCKKDVSPPPYTARPRYVHL